MGSRTYMQKDLLFYSNPWSCSTSFSWRWRRTLPKAYSSFCQCQLWTWKHTSQQTPWESRSESNRSVVDIHTGNTNGAIIVITIGGNNYVHVIHDPLEVLVELLLLQLQLQKGAVHLVHEEDVKDTLSNSLSRSARRLHHDKSSISHTESSGDLGREVNVARWVNPIDPRIQFQGSRQASLRGPAWWTPDPWGPCLKAWDGTKNSIINFLQI